MPGRRAFKLLTHSSTAWRFQANQACPIGSPKRILNIMSRKIVILDAATTSPLDLGETSPHEPNWKGLARLGNITLYPRTKPDEIADRAEGAPILLTNKVVLDATTIDALPNLKYIGLMSTGTNVVDLEAAARRGITVTNVPAYSTASVAQHAIALLLELAGRLGEQAALARDRMWSNQPDFSIHTGTLVELNGKTLGLVGCGEIAQATARIAVALGMRIRVHSRTQRETDFPCEWCGKGELLRESHAISLHCPLTKETKHWIDADALEKMRPNAFLINTGRGPLVDEAAVARALHEGTLGGYGTDVTATEPPPTDNPLLDAPRAIVTPHVAWASTEARTRLVATLEKNLEAFLNSKPIHVVTD